MSKRASGYKALIYSAGTDDDSCCLWDVVNVGKNDIKPNGIGKCDYDKMEISIYGRLGRINKISTKIHEAIHASAPFLDERSVVAMEMSIINVIMPDVKGR